MFLIRPPCRVLCVHLFCRDEVCALKLTLLSCTCIIFHLLHILKEEVIVCRSGELGELNRYVELLRGHLQSMDRLLPGISDPRYLLLSVLRWLLIHCFESTVFSLPEDGRLWTEVRTPVPVLLRPVLT